MQPDPAHTVIMTETVTARDLVSVGGRYYGVRLIDDNSPQTGLDGKPSSFARKFEVSHEYDAGRSQITVDFLDGTPGRIFELDDVVVVHYVLPGTDLRSG